MPPLPTIPTALKVAATMALPRGEVAVNTFWFSADGGVNDSALHNGIDRVKAFYNAIRPQLSSSVQLIKFQATDQSGAGAAAVEDGTVITGTGDSAMLPPQVALCCSFRSGAPGRQNRGRIYLAGVPHDAQVSDGSASGGYVTPIGNALVAHIKDLGGSILTHVVASHVPPSPHLSAVTSYRLGTVFDTIRKRRNKISEGYLTFS